MTTNPYEAEARELKARALAHHLEQREINVDVAVALDEPGRRALAELAGVNPPSQTTWTRACEMLRTRLEWKSSYEERARQQRVIEDADPFAGLS